MFGFPKLILLADSNQKVLSTFGFEKYHRKSSLVVSETVFIFCQVSSLVANDKHFG
jgi:hypothetical protein